LSLALSMKGAFFWRFFWIIMFRFKPANREFIFIELTSFISLLLAKFQASTLGVKSHQWLVKLSCKSAFENLDAKVRNLQYDFCKQYCSWARSCRGRFYGCTCYIYTLPCTCSVNHAHVQSKSSSEFALRRRLPKVDLQNLRAYKTWIFSNSWATYATDCDNVKARVPQRAWKMFGFYVIKRHEMWLR